jgi:hypothetical protein
MYLPRPLAGCVLVPVILVTLAACSSLEVALGLRVRLDKLPVTSIAASLADKGNPGPVAALAPGTSARLVIVATTQDGKQLVTAGAGHGKVLLDSFIFTPTLVQLGKRGKVTLPADPRISDGKVASIHITTVGHPEVATDLDISVRYDAAFVANFSGSDGSRGFDGTDGLDGLAGADGTSSPPDPNTGLPGPAGPGGNGSSGGNGGDGSDGGDGSPGADVHVYLRLKPGTDGVLQSKVTAGGRDSYYLIDGHGGSLRVMADGGAGGAGGLGGRAGRDSPTGWRGRMDWPDSMGGADRTVPPALSRYTSIPRLNHF